MSETNIEIVEVGPRDGLQNEAKTLPIDDRVSLINSLVAAGMHRIEAVSFVHPTKVPQMAGAEEVISQLPHSTGTKYIGLVLNRRGMERARETKVTEVNVVLPVTDGFGLANQGKDYLAMFEETKACVEMAKEARLPVTVTLAVAFGCPLEGVVSRQQVSEAYRQVLDLGPNEIAFADTIGVGVPTQVRAMIELTSSQEKSVGLRFHFHNTRNTGYANALAAVDAMTAQNRDASQLPNLALDSSVGGFGGCPFAPKATGNIATEDLTYALEKMSVIGINGTQISDLASIASWLSRALESPLQSLLPKAGMFPFA